MGILTFVSGGVTRRSNHFFSFALPLLSQLTLMLTPTTATSAMPDMGMLATPMPMATMPMPDTMATPMPMVPIPMPTASQPTVRLSDPVPDSMPSPRVLTQ